MRRKREREREIFVKMEAEKETAQIRSTLTTVPKLKQEEKSMVAAQRLNKESRQQWIVKHPLKTYQCMLVISPEVQQSTVEP